MCPTDTTPDPRDMDRVPEEQQIPQARRESADKPQREDIARRPGLPERPARMPADDPEVEE